MLPLTYAFFKKEQEAQKNSKLEKARVFLLIILGVAAVACSECTDAHMDAERLTQCNNTGC